MKSLQRVKTTKDYPVIYENAHVDTIPSFSNGVLIKECDGGTWIVDFGKWTLIVNANDLTTPTDYVKKRGFKSLNEVSKILGNMANNKPQVSRQTLTNWFFERFELFEAVVFGVRTINDTKKLINDLDGRNEQK